MIGITDLPLRDTGGGHTSGTGLVQLTKTIDIAPKVPVAGTAVIDATACTVKGGVGDPVHSANPIGAGVGRDEITTRQAARGGDR